jgi:hypothetical protein
LQESPAKIAKWILTTKRNIKSYFYSKLKPKYNAVWKTEIFNDRPGKQYGNKLRTYRLFKNNFAFESKLGGNLEFSWYSCNILRYCSNRCIV